MKVFVKAWNNLIIYLFIRTPKIQVCNNLWIKSAYFLQVKPLYLREADTRTYILLCLCNVHFYYYEKFMKCFHTFPDINVNEL